MIHKTRKLAGVIAASIAAVIVFSTHAPAKNPVVSSWTKTLSETGIEGMTGKYDYNGEIAVSGSVVHVMWMTDNEANEEIRYNRSSDGGKTWEGEKLIFSDDEMVRSETYKRMAVDGDNVHIVTAHYSGSWYGVLTYIRSSDGGASFDDPKTLFTAKNAWHIYDVRVAADNGKVTVGFRNQCNWLVDNAYIIMNSDDGGSTFSEHSAYGTNSGSSWLVGDLKRCGNNIYALYSDSYYYYGLQHGKLYIAASSDNGETFKSQMISVPSKNGNHKFTGFHDVHYVPKIAAQNNDVYVTWAGLDENDVQTVFFRKSTDNGLNFDNAIKLSDDPKLTGKQFQAGQETLAVKSGYVYVVFITTDGKVWLKRSDNNGAGFYDVQELTVSGYGLNSGWWPVVQTDPTDSTGKTVHVFWDWPSWMYSTNGGESFANPMFISPHFSYGGTLVSGANNPQMAIGNDGTLHFIVHARFYSTDICNGYCDFDIMYRRYAGVPSPSDSNKALKLYSSREEEGGRYDNMQVRASDTINFTSHMTAEVWVKPSSGGMTTGTTVVVKPIFFKRDKASGFSYSIQTYAGRQGRQAAAEITTATRNYWLTPSTDTAGIVPDNEWTHLAFTYDATAGADNFNLFMNGKLVGSTTATGNIAAENGNLFVGYYGDWEVDELSLWNKPLTPAEISANMNKTLKGDESGLMAYYNFNDTTLDITGNGNNGILMYKETYVAGKETSSSTSSKIAAAFAGYGLYYYDGASWNRITETSPQDMTSWGNRLAVDFGQQGLYLYDGTNWTWLAASPEKMTVWEDALILGYPAYGLYAYDGAWTYIHAYPEDMAAWDYFFVLALDYGTYGLYLYDGWDWYLIGPSPEKIVSWGEYLVADYGNSGLYLFEGFEWKFLHQSPEDMISWGKYLVLDYGSYGLYLYDGTTWKWISISPENMIAGDGYLAADFGKYGLYLYDGTSWKWIGGDPSCMAAWER